MEIGAIYRFVVDKNRGNRLKHWEIFLCVQR